MTKLNGEPTRRVRIVYEADIDYRADEPGYCLSVASTNWWMPGQNVRFENIALVSAEFPEVPGE